MLQDFIDEFMASLSTREQEYGGNNQNTIVAYRNDLHQLRVYLEEQREIGNWPQVTREHIAAYMLNMREYHGYRPTTIARKLASLKSFFRYMYSKGMVPTDPVESLEAPRVQKDPPNVLSAEQLQNLFSQVEVELPVGQRDFAMLNVLYSTGMRVTELVSLDLHDFDAERAADYLSGAQQTRTHLAAATRSRGSDTAVSRDRTARYDHPSPGRTGAVPEPSW